MNRINFNQLMERETWLYLVRRMKFSVRWVGQWLLIQHSHAFDVAAVALVLLMTSYLVVTLLYLDPPGVNMVPSEQSYLATDVLDRLKLWTEQRVVDQVSDFKIPEGKL